LLFLLAFLSHKILGVHTHLVILNAEGVHGQRKDGNPWFRVILKISGKYLSYRKMLLFCKS